MLNVSVRAFWKKDLKANFPLVPPTRGKTCTKPDSPNTGQTCRAAAAHKGYLLLNTERITAYIRLNSLMETVLCHSSNTTV